MGVPTAPRPPQSLAGIPLSVRAILGSNGNAQTSARYFPVSHRTHAPHEPPERMENRPHRATASTEVSAAGSSFSALSSSPWVLESNMFPHRPREGREWTNTATDRASSGSLSTPPWTTIYSIFCLQGCMLSTMIPISALVVCWLLKVGNYRSRGNGEAFYPCANINETIWTMRPPDAAPLPSGMPAFPPQRSRCIANTVLFPFRLFLDMVLS